MKSIQNTKLNLKKVTISTHSIYGASDSSYSNNSNDNPTDETLSSAFDEPTENPINPLFVSLDAAICA
ncbi:MAG: hypothetical protein AB8B65_01480 [Kordia sp.]|uniref:hypothetical protein n=1 Tax=Kordia sp. TaxID=1965332 RepID=UPI00385EDA77